MQGAAALGLDEAGVLRCLGESTWDVYLNDVAYWRNVLLLVERWIWAALNSVRILDPAIVLVTCSGS